MKQIETRAGSFRGSIVLALGVIAAILVITPFLSKACAQEAVTFNNNTTREVFVYLQYGPSSDGSCAGRPYNKKFLMESSEFRRWSLGPDPVCYCYSVAGWPTADNCELTEVNPGDTVDLR